MRLLLEQTCLVCKQASHQAICHYCVDDLPLFDVKRYQFNLLLAPQIRKGLIKVDFPHILALSDYQWPISNLISRLKFSACIPHAKALANLFVSHCAMPQDDRPEMIIPMPIHNNRYLKRKFNQSIEIAKHLASLSEINLDTNIIKRVKSTQAQTDLNAQQRRNNLHNAFKLTEHGLSKLTRIKQVALFDDVITTGTTMNYAYRTLKRSFPDLRINVWSICLTLVH